jgi:hypothetical protein
VEIRDKQLIEVEDGSPRQIREGGGGLVRDDREETGPTLGTADWKRMLVTGMGAEDNMEMITTSTSDREGGESRAKWNSTRKLCLSNTVTGNKLPRGQTEA